MPPDLPNDLLIVPFRQADENYMLAPVQCLFHAPTRLYCVRSAGAVNKCNEAISSDPYCRVSADCNALTHPSLAEIRPGGIIGYIYLPFSPLILGGAYC
jgi:hypothetical protein